LMAKVLELWSPEVIEEALGDDADRVFRMRFGLPNSASVCRGITLPCSSTGRSRSRRSSAVFSRRTRRHRQRASRRVIRRHSRLRRRTRFARRRSHAASLLTRTRSTTAQLFSTTA
jgi:hypothetical protein